MVLLTLIGWALQTFAEVPNALVFGLLLGFVAANFVPARGACPLPPREPR